MSFSFPISSITSGPRQTNMELLRIVAMLLVLAVHANFVAFGVVPESLDGLTAGQWSVAVLRVGAESLSLVCVNLFILISGWFGIRPTMRGAMQFLFQVMFFFLLSYGVLAALGMTHVNVDTLLDTLCLGPSAWFVKAYLALYILSPLLNAAVDKLSQGQLRRMVVAFYLYQTIWGFIGINNSVGNGYTAFSFIGLYLLARYLRLYYHEHRRHSWLLLYFAMSVLTTIAYFTFPTSITVMSYANPLVVIASVGLMMWFAGLRCPHSSAVNRVARSAFAVYLLHASPAMMVHYSDAVRGAYNLSTGFWGFLSVLLVMAAFFVAAIAIDQLRLLLWSRIAVPLSHFSDRLFKIISS